MLLVGEDFAEKHLNSRWRQLVKMHIYNCIFSQHVKLLEATFYNASLSIMHYRPTSNMTYMSGWSDC